MKRKHISFFNAVCLSLLVIFLFQIGGTSAINTITPPIGEVNPADYTLGVSVGEQRTYVFHHIDQYNASTGYGSRDFHLVLPEGNITKTLLVSENTKVIVTIEGISVSGIDISLVFETFDSTYQSEILSINRSLLSVVEGNLPRFIMTTNIPLIHDIYEFTEWYVDDWDDRVRIGYDYEEYDNTYEPPNVSYHYEYEYDRYSGWLINYRVNLYDETGMFNVEMSEIMTWDPADYTLGVSIGDNRTYTFAKIVFYDWNTDTYQYELFTPIIQDGLVSDIKVQAGDNVTITVTHIDEISYELQATFILKEGGILHDETIYRFDRSYLSSQKEMPIFVLTNNHSLAQQIFPGMWVDNGFMKVSWEGTDSSGSYFNKDKMEWEKTTGWLHHMYSYTSENGRTNHEMDIIDSRYYMDESPYPEPTWDDSWVTIGTQAGDSVTYMFTVLTLSAFGDGLTTVDQHFTIELPINGVWQEVVIQQGDTMKIDIIDVYAPFIKYRMTIVSSTNGTVTGDPVEYNIAQMFHKDSSTNESDGGPMFIMTNNVTLIESFFNKIPEVTLYNDGTTMTVTVEYSKDDDFTTERQTMVYDIASGWLLSIEMEIFQNNNSMVVLRAEAIEKNINPPRDTGDKLDMLTPFAELPILILSILSFVCFSSRKRR
ncbi:MAG: hypothetical protein ACFFAU_07865 [Candidatus Hodarchaeota archaeon]